MYSASFNRYVTSTEAIFTKMTLAGQLLVKNSCTEFHEILTSVLTDETTSQTDRRSGVISAKSADGSQYLAFIARQNLCNRTCFGYKAVVLQGYERWTAMWPALRSHKLATLLEPCCHVRLVGRDLRNPRFIVYNMSAWN